jgi:hypothetical protein
MQVQGCGQEHRRKQGRGVPALPPDGARRGAGQQRSSSRRAAAEERHLHDVGEDARRQLQALLHLRWGGGRTSLGLPGSPAHLSHPERAAARKGRLAAWAAPCRLPGRSGGPAAALPSLPPGPAGSTSTSWWAPAPQPTCLGLSQLELHSLLTASISCLDCLGSTPYRLWSSSHSWYCTCRGARGRAEGELDADAGWPAAAGRADAPAAGVVAGSAAARRCRLSGLPPGRARRAPLVGCPSLRPRSPCSSSSSART